MPDLNIIRKMNQPENIALTKHARERLSERNIKIVDIVHGIKTGEIIKHYEDDKPLSSCLILGKSENGDYLHIVVSNGKEYIFDNCILSQCG